MGAGGGRRRQLTQGPEVPQCAMELPSTTEKLQAFPECQLYAERVEGGRPGRTSSPFTSIRGARMELSMAERTLQARHGCAKTPLPALPPFPWLFGVLQAAWGSYLQGLVWGAMGRLDIAPPTPPSP